MATYHVSHDTNKTYFAVYGRVDSVSALEFGLALNKMIDDGHRDIVLNFDQCSYMSSAGLREIVHGLKRIRELNGRMCSKPVPFTIGIVFDTSGLTRILKCEDE